MKKPFALIVCVPLFCFSGSAEARDGLEDFCFQVFVRALMISKDHQFRRSKPDYRKDDDSRELKRVTLSLQQDVKQQRIYTGLERVNVAVIGFADGAQSACMANGEFPEKD